MVILCGGLATRLGALTKETPKSMIPIEGKPFLEHQIEILKKQDITDIILCVGHLSEKIREYFDDGQKFGIHIKYSQDGDKPLGPIGALKKAENLLDDIFFIMYGDSYLSVDFQNIYTSFLKNEKLAMMAVYKNKDKYDTSNLIVHKNQVVAYGKEHKTDEMVYIDYGTSILRKKALASIPLSTFYSTGTFFSDLVKKQELLAYEVKHRFYHIGTPQAIDEFTRYIKTISR